MNKAVLYLFVKSVTTAGAIDVSNVLSTWTESAVTFNNVPAQGAVQNTVSVSVALDWVAVDITSLVQGWLTTPSSNLGVMITASTTAPNTVVNFDTKETTLTSHPAFLDVVLIGPAGATGATGATGPTGPQGPTGPAGGGLAGSGTVGNILQWTGTTTAGNSIISQSASNISVAGAVSASSLTSSGTVTGGSLVIAGSAVVSSVSATGAVSAGSLSTTGAAAVGSLASTGAVAAPSFSTSGATASGSLPANVVSLGQFVVGGTPYNGVFFPDGTVQTSACGALGFSTEPESVTLRVKPHEIRLVNNGQSCSYVIDPPTFHTLMDMISQHEQSLKDMQTDNTTMKQTIQELQAQIAELRRLIGAKDK